MHRARAVGENDLMAGARARRLAGSLETMKQLVIPNEVRNLALVPFCSGNNARFLTSFGMTALFQRRSRAQDARAPARGAPLCAAY